MTRWYSIINESSVFTPSILVYPYRIAENIRRMTGIAGDVSRLRPHIKTHKIPEIIRLQVDLGIRKFKCATLPELEMAAANGGNDILLAYPLIGPAISHYFKITSQFPDVIFAVTVDSEASASELNQSALKADQTVRVFVDLDNGMHRTGISPEKAEPLVRYIQGAEKLQFAGLHIYDGHIHDINPEERKIHTDRDFEQVDKLVQKLGEMGITVEEMACGGTPTFPIHALHQERTLCPGTPVLWDAGYSDAIPDLDFLPAAVIAGRVISRPQGNLCLDLGYKAFASEMAHPRLKFLDFEPGNVLNHSEEHLVVAPGTAGDIEIGRMVYALPRHVCPTMALHEKVYVVNDHQATETWEVIARKRIY